MISSYKVEGNKIVVNTPYSETIVAQCRKWAGKFEKGRGWVLPLSRLPEIQAVLGVNQEDQVEVEVGGEHFSGYAQIQTGWFVLVGRRGRDRGADVYADLVAGEIPSSGGSVKNPRVGESADAKFRLWVPRDFALAHNLPIVNETPVAPFVAPVDPLTAAVEAGIAKINSEGSATVDPKAEAIAKIRALMTEHGIEFSDLLS